MSHFTVAVFTDGNQSIEELLAPYQENNMDDCPKEYLEFHSVEEEYRNEYENDGCEMVRLKNGELVHTWDDIFRKKGEFGFGTGTHEVPDEYEKVFVKHKDRFKTFEEFIKDWAGYEEKNEETGEYGYWENPNKKWDWWTIGGRWSKLLKSKYEYIDKSEWENERTLPSRDNPEGEELIKDENGNLFIKTDSAKIKDIDFSLDKDKYNKARRFWELKIEKDEPKNKEDEDLLKWDWYKDEYYTSRYKSKEDYAIKQSLFETYAAITPDGVWHSKGDMGWWGCSSETAEEYTQWQESFIDRFITNANPEWTITIVDCHI